MEWITELIAPVITGLVTLCGLILANRKAAAVKEAKDELKEQELSRWRTEVSDRLAEHNNYAKLFSEQSVVLARIDERLKALEGKQ